MTATERIELLKAVADCAPEWMGAKYVKNDFGEPETWTTFWDVDYRPSMSMCHGDVNDADAIIAMLDAMEKAGWNPSVIRVSGGKYHASKSCSGAVVGVGSTRAEAVARAFVAVFGGKE